MEEKTWMLLQTETQVRNLMQTNQYTESFGLTLSEESALALAQDRLDTLRAQRRGEFGGGILEKLIFAFCDSDYIRQEEYAEILARLQEIFYLYKNESLDELSDDELIAYMREAFEERCHGDLEYLESTCLEDFARNVRQETRAFMDRRYLDEE